MVDSEMHMRNPPFFEKKVVSDMHISKPSKQIRCGEFGNA